jgi:hypothetical protein
LANKSINRTQTSAPVIATLGVSVDWKIVVAIAGWLLAISQFAFTFREAKEKNEAELLEKTLNYFNQGIQDRTIGISLVEGIWWKRKKNLDIILPVLISQVLYLVTEAEDTPQDNRNLIRLLFLIEKILPYESNGSCQLAEISEALMWGAQVEDKGVSSGSLRAWFKRLNGEAETWDAEIGNS